MLIVGEVPSVAVDSGSFFTEWVVTWLVATVAYSRPASRSSYEAQTARTQKAFIWGRVFAFIPEVERRGKGRGGQKNHTAHAQYSGVTQPQHCPFLKNEIAALACAALSTDAGLAAELRPDWR